MKLLNVTILFFLLLTSHKGLCQDTLLWVGNNLTEILYEDGNWFYQNGNDEIEIRKIDSKYFVYDFMSDEIKNEIGFNQLDSQLDTIKLSNESEVKLFIKPDLAQFSNYSFHTFEYTTLDQFGGVNLRYHINRFGIFRKSNFKNETIIELQVSDSLLNEFRTLVQRIDVEGMNEAKGWRNNCDNTEHRFTFWDNYGLQYQYTAIAIRKQLQSIMDFVMRVKKE